MIALALLAAATIGLATLGNEIELPLIGDSSKVAGITKPDLHAEMLLIEQNSFDYASPMIVEEVRFLETNGWEWTQHVTGRQAVPMQAQDYQFLEKNSWDTNQLVPPEDNGSRDF